MPICCPYPSHSRELSFMPALNGTGMPKINVLLCVLIFETNMVCGLTKMRRARHANVAIGNIKAAQVTCISICILLNQVGISDIHVRGCTEWRNTPILTATWEILWV
jgi:hypothetical protein